MANVQQAQHITTIVGFQAEAIKNALAQGETLDWVDESIPGLSILKVYLYRKQADK